MKSLVNLAAIALLACIAGTAFANPCPPGNPPTNCGPPTGTTVFDLAGQAIPHSPTVYTTSFVATDASTNISFALREDPAFWYLDNVSVTTGGGSNLLTNGDFEAGMTGWTALNTFGATFAGAVESGGFCTGQCWVDGSVQGYDGLTQIISTTIGATYNVSFSLSNNGPLTVAQQLSTNGDVTDTGGNGSDVLLYAGAVPTINGVPEPATLSLLGLGLAGFGFMRRKRAN